VNSRSVRNAPRISHDGNVNIGAISIFALIVILCMAVLSVLTLATAHSSLVLSRRQAVSVQELYLNETAAQTFVAEAGSMLGGGGTTDQQLTVLCERAESAVEGKVEATARMSGQSILADFTCENGRVLKVTLTMLPDGTYRIDNWRMTAMENEEQPIGTLYIGE
jgi:hypothetical protein